ncbi:BQ2448_6620 [Microbotryum intermedium]|uniref:BQ2448_6620 protein n=1 Tax=Microbotryum intermedium TaxID=269621 RepID=A0A238FSH6_9BASI|nr:BQ2448_6620 [Microbotryum intermedium]
MPPKGMSNSKAIFAHPLQTQADDAKYRTKYQQLKGKLQEVEQDNAKLALRVLRSKKSIQRLRIERAILYDRLQNSSNPTDPYKLRTSAHLSKLSTATTSTTSEPTNEGTSTIPEGNEASTSTSAVVPVAPQQDVFLQPMSQAKLAALVQPPPFSEQDATPPTGVKDWGERPYVGVVGEGTPIGAQQVEVAQETTKAEDGNEGEQAMQE